MSVIACTFALRQNCPHASTQRHPPRAAAPRAVKIPQSQAESELKDRIEAGRELAATQIPGLDAGAPTSTALRGSLNAPYGFGSNRIPELDALKRRVRQWRDYNQTWLDRNLGGEAADEYKRASTHWGFGGTDNPEKELGFLREDIESEASKLESIHDRLHMWPPAEDLTSAAPGALQATPGAPIFIVHGSDTMRAEAIARTVERATGRETIILREQPNLGQTLIEKFENNATQASYAIIVLTPDDHGSRKGEPGTRPRGRQNVIFEMGYFYGRIGRRNVAVLIDPTVEKPSDTDGIAYITLDDNGAWKSELFRELHHAYTNVTP